MNDFLIGLAGHAFGIDDATLVKLEGDIPKFQRLVQLSIQARPIIAEAEQIWASIAPEVQTVLKQLGANK